MYTESKRDISRAILWLRRHGTIRTDQADTSDRAFTWILCKDLEKSLNIG